MSPVLATEVSDARAGRRPVVVPEPTLFSDLRNATDPEPRAGDVARVMTGPGGSLPAGTDCPPMPTDTSCGPHAHDGRGRTAPAALVGIARLAASSPPAETRRKSEERPQYFALPVRSMLNRCESNRVPFEWTINPYRGCEFGCHYCYARYTHEYMEIDGREFERKIFVKQRPDVLLARDINRKYSFRPDGAPEHIAIGSATDPYQPAENEFGVTRACLEELARRRGLRVSIITKSNHIVRDVDVLQRIAERSTLSIQLSVTTMRARLARLLEPRAPRPDLRIGAVKTLREAGLSVGVFSAPVLPGINDSAEEMESVAAAAREAGALWYAAGVLFLMPSSKKKFMPFLREKFPRLAEGYAKWYERDAYPPEAYRKIVSERVKALQKKYAFQARPWDELKQQMPCAQMTLGLSGEGISERLRSCATG